MKPIEYLVEARVDVRESVKWYLERDTTVPSRFLSEIDVAVAKITSNPDIGHPSERGTRSVSLDHFPFRVIFREFTERIVIIAVMHHRRRPGVWYRRLKSLEN